MEDQPGRPGIFEDHGEWCCWRFLSGRSAPRWGDYSGRSGGLALGRLAAGVRASTSTRWTVGSGVVGAGWIFTNMFEVTDASVLGLGEPGIRAGVKRPDSGWAGWR